jgi:hypothetical protein
LQSFKGGSARPAEINPAVQQLPVFLDGLGKGPARGEAIAA